MLRPCVSKTSLCILPDFLVPGLLGRSSRAYSQRPRKPVLQQNSPTANFGQLKDRLTAFHSPTANPQRTDSTDVFNSTVLQIRHALRSRDIQSVWKLWQDLKRQNLLRFLGPLQLQQISSLLQSFCPADDPGRPWNTEERRVTEEIALAVAVSRATDALTACLHAYIRRKDPDAALALYHRFIALVKERDEIDDKLQVSKDTSQDETAFGYDAVLVSGPLNVVESTPYLPGRTAVLLAAITAYALKDNFAAALQTCIDTTIRLHPPATSMFIQQLLYDSSLHDKVESWVNRLRVAPLIARPVELSKRINALTQTRGIKPLEKLYQTIMDGVSGPEPFIAAHASQQTSSKPIVLSEVIWTSFLTAFLKLGRKDLAMKLWDDMIALNVRPGITTWTAYIDACDTAGMYDSALKGWDMMLQQNVQPDHLTYRALISTYFNARQPDKAQTVFNIYRAEHLSQPQVSGNTSMSLIVHNTVLHGLLTNGMYDEASNLLSEMRRKGPAPDVITYNSFLRYWSRAGDFKKLASIVGDMSKAGVSGDVFSYSTILSALLKAGREDAPDVVLSLMLKNGVNPNVATYSAIMNQQLQERTIPSLQAAMRLLQRMELDPAAQPNEVTYTSFLAGIYRGGWLPPPVAEDFRKNIVARMRKRNIVPNRVTYHILLTACLDYPEPEGLQNALTYFAEMQKHKLSPVYATWYIMLKGLHQRQEWNLADEFVQNMYSTGFRPQGPLLEVVGKISRRTIHDRQSTFYLS